MADEKEVKKVLAMIKEHDVKYVDFRFTDPRGKWQHLAHTIATVDEAIRIRTGERGPEAV